MGIQRLLHDLLPYAERIVLGTAPRGTPEAITIRSLIIDGPSLVYFVYNKILASHAYATLPPTYNEINQGVHHILGDIQRHGVSIRHIFFDGGLPKSKRQIRLGRMEKVRKQLEIFRKVHSDFPPVAPSSTEVRDFEKLLWDISLTSTRMLTLPSPPFMVASAVETLRASTSPWRDRVQVVAGEADMFCALAARDSADTVAILTDDTDLAVHDLGPNGRVALLHSIEMEPQKRSPNGPAFLVALSINPTSVASRLNVFSLLAFGFERSLDSTVSTAVIHERATNLSRTEQSRAEYATFLEEFLPSTTPSEDTQLELDGIDPRTAELIVTLKNAPHIYLTPILEDPQRDSSWSYGAGIRQLTYSILLSSAISGTEKNENSTAGVIEHAKKGQRIAPTTVPILKRVDFISQAAELEALLAIYLPRACQGPFSGGSTALAAWYAIAIHLVHQGKVKLDKSSPSLDRVLRLFGLLQTTNFAMNESATVSWDDIHLLANIHAVLYSLRILYQITGYILKRPGQRADCGAMPDLDLQDDEKLLEITQELHKTLSRMPPIADLFLDIAHLRRKLGEISNETQNSTIFRLKGVLEPSTERAFVGRETVADREESQHVNIEHQNGDRMSAKSKKRRGRDRHAEENIDPTRSRNMFGLLLEDTG